LVGPDLLMTVAHAFPFPLDKHPKPPVPLQARFDYHHRPGMDEPAQGRRVALAADDWLLGWSPPPGRTEDAAVDTAVVRLSEPAGMDPVGGAGDPRGWLDLAVNTANLPVGSGLAIIGHPEGGPLKLAINTQSVVGYDPTTGHLMYRTDTL